MKVYISASGFLFNCSYAHWDEFARHVPHFSPIIESRHSIYYFKPNLNKFILKANLKIGGPYIFLIMNIVLDNDSI